MDGGAWWARVHGGHKELNTSERLKLPLSVCEWTCRQVDSIVTDPFLLGIIEL